MRWGGGGGKEKEPTHDVFQFRQILENSFKHTAVLSNFDTHNTEKLHILVGSETFIFSLQRLGGILQGGVRT